MTLLPIQRISPIDDFLSNLRLACELLTWNTKQRTAKMPPGKKKSLLTFVWVVALFIGIFLLSTDVRKVRVRARVVFYVRKFMCCE